MIFEVEKKGEEREGSDSQSSICSITYTYEVWRCSNHLLPCPGHNMNLLTDAIVAEYLYTMFVWCQEQRLRCTDYREITDLPISSNCTVAACSVCTYICI